MSENKYLKILRWGIYLTFLTPLLIFQSLLFPFITGKVFYFRIIIEILFVIYVLFVYQYPKYLPKKNALNLVLIVFTIILVITSFTGIDFNLSFWGDIERMEGAFTFLHLAAYFFIISSVFKTKEDWENLFYIFLGFSLCICFYGVGQKIGIKGVVLPNEERIPSTLGNAAYLAAYSLFGISIILILLFKSQDWFKKIIYLFAFFLHLAILFFTGTRGAYLGLICGILLALVLYIILSPSKKVKQIFFIFLMISLIIGVILFKNRDKEIFSKNHYLYRLTHISFAEATWNTRLISWKAGWKGFQERPFGGVGSGNYAYFFDKYFDPLFYTFTESQTYFDHAHNMIIDIAVTTGMFGLIMYIGIFVVLISYLILDFRAKKIDLNEFIILLSLLAAYIMQNLFVFDCLATFMAFILIAAYILYKHSDKVNDARNLKAMNRNFSPILAIILSLGSLILILKYNLKPAYAMVKSVDAQYEMLRNSNLMGGYELYKKSLSYNTILDRDIRTSLSNLILHNISRFINKTEVEDLLKVVDFSIEEEKKNLKLNPEDAFLNLQVGDLYNLRAQLSRDSIDLENGKLYLKRALKASPCRLQIHFSLAQNNALSQKYDEALIILEEARRLNPKYDETYINLAKIYNFKGDEKNFFNMMGEAILLGHNIGDGDRLYNLIDYFTKDKKYDILFVLYHQLLRLEPLNAKAMARLAVVCKELGKKQEAIEMVKKAIEIDPSLKENGNKFLESLEK